MNNKSDYDFYKSIGICVRCHKNQAEPNRVISTIIIEALEKQFPKKVAFKRNAYGGISVCPICGASDYGKYCRQCGQKIDWGE